MISLPKQHTLILLLAILCVSNAFQCPDISQRKFRQSGICNKMNQSYVCLYDVNLKKFVEFCGHKPEIQRPGFEFIFSGNLDGSECKKFRYQPIRFWTNESSECIFKKSSCNGEGLIVHKEGNSTSDKTCRCDYTRGYDFVDRPKGECYCNPITEDCSCYRKQCNINQVLTPDYNCIRTNQWTGIFNCVIIKKQIAGVESAEKKETNTEAYLPKMNICEEEKIMFTATVIFVLIVFGICLKLPFMYRDFFRLISPATEKIGNLQKWQDEEKLIGRLKRNHNDIVSFISNHEILEYLMFTKIFSNTDRDDIKECLGHRNKNRKLLEILMQHGSEGYHAFMSALTQNDKYVKLKVKIEGSKGLKSTKIECQEDFNEKISKKLRDVFETYISNWYHDDAKFTVTYCTIEIEKLLREKNAVLLIGLSGNGKSAIVRHIALKLFNEEGYDIVPIVVDPSTILQYHNPERNQVFVIDDFCGKMVVDVQKFELWSSTIDDVLNLIMRTEHPDGTLNKGTVKLLFATVPDVSESKMFQRINCLLDYKFDLSEMPLHDDEKIEMIKKYLTKEQISANLPESLNFQKNIFPLLCKLSTGKTAKQIIQLFKNHKEVIKQDFLDIKQKDKHQICLIGLCVLLDGLKENIFDEEITSQRDKFIIKNVCLEFDLDISKETTRLKLHDEIKDLDESYFVKSGHSYQFVHSEVYNIAALFFGDIMQNSFIRFAPSSLIAERYSLLSVGDSTRREDTIVIKDEETEKVYFDRLMTDLEQGITYSTFHNSQLANVSYRNKFCKYCRHRDKKIVELLNRLHKHSSESSDHLDDKTTCASKDSVDNYEDYIEFTEPYHFASHKMKIPLLESALQGNKDIVNLLIEMKLNIDETDKFGRSALFIACFLGREDVAILLLDEGANHELTDNNDRTPLYAACKGGFLTIVNALLRKRADLIKSDKNGCCALHAASETGHKKIVEKLLEHKNNEIINKCDNYGRSALFLASYNGKTKVVKVLVEKHAKIDKCDNKGFSPLMAACTRGHNEVAEFLINTNADIFKTDNDSRSALYMACKKGHLNIVRILLEKGANALQSDWHQRSPLFIASSLGHDEIVNLLVGNMYIDSMIQQSDEEGKSPLFIACEKGHESIVNVLLEHGLFEVLEQTDKRQRTPLYVACRGGFIKIVEKLVRTGAQIDNVNIWQATPLFAACREGHSEVVQYLIEANANLNLVDSNGQTPLSVACDEGYDEIVKSLVDHESNIHHQDNDGRTPLQIAQLRGHTDIINFLEQQKTQASKTS